METMLNIPALDILIMGEARMEEYRLRNTNNWETCYGSRHTNIENIFRNSIFERGNDKAITRISCNKLYELFLERVEKW